MRTPPPTGNASVVAPGAMPLRAVPPPGRPATAAGAAASAPARSALIVAFAAIYLIWGSTYLGMRVAVETMPPFAMAGLRFLLAGSVLFAFLRLRGAPWPTARQWRVNTIAGTLLLLGGNGLVAWAEQSVPSGVTALLIGVQPLFFVLAEWAWPGGLRPTAATALALLLGFAGVACLAAPWDAGPGGGLDPAGVGAILAACGFWAVGSIYSRHAQRGAEPFFAAAQQMLGGGVALALAAGLHGDWTGFDFGAVSFRSWGAFFYLVMFGSLIGFSTFVWLMKHSTPARVSTYAYVNPIIAVFLGWLLLREPVTPRTLLAAAVIVVAVVIITTRKSRAAAKP
jgi:drug/metabolite transporter (DMT)-like permease